VFPVTKCRGIVVGDAACTLVYSWRHYRLLRHLQVGRTEDINFTAAAAAAARDGCVTASEMAVAVRMCRQGRSRAGWGVYSSLDAVVECRISLADRLQS